MSREPLTAKRRAAIRYPHHEEITPASFWGWADTQGRKDARC